MSDLISRQDAVEAVYNALRTPLPDYKIDPFHDSMSLAISIVNALPSAKSEKLKTWVLVSEYPHGGVWCHGIFNDYARALGTAILMILETKESYQDDEDFFSYTEPDTLEGDGGDFILVQYKCKNEDKLNEEYYYILDVEQ